MHKVETVNCCSSDLERYQCQLCMFSTHFLVDFREHRQLCYLHNGQHIIVAMDTIQENVENSIQSAHTPNDIITRFQCNYCDYKAKLRRGLMLHETRKHKSEFAHLLHEFKCDQCDYSSDNKIYLRKHKMRRHAEEMRWFQCEHCDTKYRQNQALQNHIATKHTPSDHINWFKCDQCVYSTRLKSELRHHKHQHGRKIRWFTCDTCDYKNRSKFGLRHHILTKHMASDQVNWLKCDQCDFKTLRAGNLTTHRTNIHEHAKPFECDQCEFKSRYRKDLTHHQITHLSDDQKQGLQCEQCEYKCVTQSSLTRHIRRVHKQIWFNGSTAISAITDSR